MSIAGDIESIYIGDTPQMVGEKFAVFAISKEKLGQGHGRRMLSRHYERDEAEAFRKNIFSRKKAFVIDSYLKTIEKNKIEVCAFDIPAIKEFMSFPIATIDAPLLDTDTWQI